MRGSCLLALSAAAPALLIFATPAHAQTRPAGGGPRITLPTHSNHFSWEGKRGGFHGFGGGVWIVEREVPVIVEKEVVREVRVPTPSPSPEGEGKQRKPYVIGQAYASLPSGCMKMLEEGASYYYCGGGEWYRQTGKLYRAVARKL